MRNIIYIAGIGATGKSSLASTLGKKLGIPMVSVDEVYRLLYEKLEKKYPLQKFSHWGELMLVDNQKKYPDFAKYKKEAYVEFLNSLKGDVVIEGFPLVYADDRLLIGEIIGPHWGTYFLLELSFEKWADVSSSKYGQDSSYAVYRSYVNCFEPPEHFYTIKDFKYKLDIDRVEYQKVNFTDEKWKRMRMEKLTGKTVLDCGCNDGWIGKYCLDAGAKNVLGLDNNWLYLEEARKKGVDTRLFDLDEMYELGEQFDITLCLATLHHLKNMDVFIGDISRITKEMFVLEVPIWDNDEIAIKYRRDQGVFIPTSKFIIYWLGKYFKRVEIVGQSIPPGDDSYRLIFKAYK